MPTFSAFTTNSPSSGSPFSSSNPFGSMTGTQGPSNSNGNPSGPSNPFGSMTGTQGTSNSNGHPSGLQLFRSGAFGATTSAAGASFGAPNQPFSSSNVFGSTSGGHQTSNSSGNPSTQIGAFGAPSPAPSFGGFSLFSSSSQPFGNPSIQTGAFGATTSSSASTPSFGTSTPFSGTSAFNSANSLTTSGFGVPSNWHFGVSKTPTFNFGTFGQPTIPVSGKENTAPFFKDSSIGKSVFPINQKGSKLAPYTATPEEGSSNDGNIQSICCMHIYKDKSQEELRFEDYQLGEKGTSGFGVINNSNPFKSAVFNQPTQPSHFQSTNPFAMKKPGVDPLSNKNSTIPVPTPFTKSLFPPQTSFLNTPTGSRGALYVGTRSEENGQANTIISISAMPNYSNKSQEELRLEDYQSAKKGGLGLTENSVSSVGVATPASQVNPFVSTPASQVNPFVSTPASQGNPFVSTPTPTAPDVSFFPKISSNPFAPSKPTFNPPTTPTFPTLSNPWPLPTSSAPSLTHPVFSDPITAKPPGIGFVPNSSNTPFTFHTSPTPWVTNPVSSSSSLASTFTHPITAKPPGNDFVHNSSSPSFTLPTLSPVSQMPVHPIPVLNGGVTCCNCQKSSQSSFQFQPTSANLFNVSSTSSLGLDNSNKNTLLSPLAPLVTPAPATIPTAIASQQDGASSSGVGNLGTNGLQSYSPSITVLQPSPTTLPTETQLAVQLSLGHRDSAISLQYGISSLPVTDKAAPAKLRSSLIIRQSPLSRHRLPPQKYNPSSDKPRVPFFMDKENGSGPLKNEAAIFPRENPRDWIRSVTEAFPVSCESSQQKHSVDGMHNGDAIGSNCGDPNSAAEETRDDIPGKLERCLHVSLEGTDGDGDGDGTVHDVEAIMPKLKRADYYTVPHIDELTSKEKEQPGFISHVKDFIVGRHGFGSVKFSGETDVRKLDLDSLVHFNSREVIIYMDESNKPPVGQGLNKPAEITLLNVKCINKSTGEAYKDGPAVDKYRDLLIKMAVKQGAEFVSYDPEKGEWKFKVSHF